MPAVSKNQQQLMEIVHSIQKGEKKPSTASKQAQKIAKTIEPAEATKFASTKHKGLPKKVKKEGVLDQVYAVQKPYSGCKPQSMIHTFSPLQGLPADKVTPDQIHGVYQDQLMAQDAAQDLYEDYCKQEAMLEEKKGKTSDQIKKAIDKLEKKRKEHVDLAKEDPKNAAQHKEHIAKIAQQIDDLMSKMEKIEKSKKQIEKAEEKKEEKK